MKVAPSILLWPLLKVNGSAHWSLTYQGQVQSVGPPTSVAGYGQASGITTGHLIWIKAT